MTEYLASADPTDVLPDGSETSGEEGEFKRCEFHYLRYFLVKSISCVVHVCIYVCVCICVSLYVLAYVFLPLFYY